MGGRTFCGNVEVWFGSLITDSGENLGGPYRSIIAEFIPDIRFDQMQPQDTLAPNPAKFKMGFGAVRNKTSSFPTTLFWTGAPTPIVVSICSSVLPQIGKKIL